ncbi:hypothetical protein HNR23_002363 [Nocardiopsis mwathae]|uniref:Uncharacterized protein n=1 Tax=Nocardiopsis mwathae TaxID=1472723 RepID=A0A7W9YHM6_9ACTN|nr:hypothetical protein [Nocardiopsis mwathae]
MPWRTRPGRVRADSAADPVVRATGPDPTRPAALR